MQITRVQTFTVINIENDEGDRLAFEFNGSLTVNVFRVEEVPSDSFNNPTGDLFTCIDVFMFSEMPTLERVEERCVAWAAQYWGEDDPDEDLCPTCGSERSYDHNEGMWACPNDYEHG